MLAMSRSCDLGLSELIDKQDTCTKRSIKRITGYSFTISGYIAYKAKLVIRK
jgi:hypothetical protein